MRKQNDTLTVLAPIITRQGWGVTLSMLGEVCMSKAEHITENWQDDATAKTWQAAGSTLAKLADAPAVVQVDALDSVGDTAAESADLIALEAEIDLATLLQVLDVLHLIAIERAEDAEVAYHHCPSKVDKHTSVRARMLITRRMVTFTRAVAERAAFKSL